jgi:cysteine-rich repeat protein
MRRSAANFGRATTRLGVLALLLLSGHGLALATTADDLCAANADPCVVDTVVEVDNGSTISLGARRLLVDAGGRLDVGPGTMTIAAAAVDIANRGELRANGGSDSGGQITVDAGSIEVIGAIVANGSIGGDVSLTASGVLRVAGTITADGNTGLGFGGNIALSGGELSVAANLSAAGSSRGLGGCITFNAVADALLGGSVRANGGEGGEIAVVVGGGPAGGNLSFLSNTALVVTGTNPEGGSGGDIDISARGNGDDTGHVIIDGDAQARGAFGRDGGGDGGTIDVSAAGDLIGAAGSGMFDVNGGAPDGLAGEINVDAGRNATLANRLQAQSGSEGTGGDIAIEAAADLTLASQAQVSTVAADDGGTIDLLARQGIVRILAATLDTSGILGGDGGEVTIAAPGAAGGVLITGSVFADGSSFRMTPGSGGVIDIAAGDFVTLSGSSQDPAGKIQAQGGSGGGAGGTINVRTGSGLLRLDGNVEAPGLGADSEGGTIAAVSGDGLTVAGTLNVGTNSQGGLIGLESTSTTDIVGNVTGGTIEVVADADVTISGTLTADGSSGAEAMSGLVSISGCALSVTATGRLVAVGARGRNQLVGRRETTIAGRLQADADDGVNALIYRDAATPPLVLASAVIIPGRQEILDTTLLPCPICGDRSVEFPETCDDGNQLDGDGCSSSCQTEPAGQCDVDGNGQANLVDLVNMAREIFDGDGDRVIDVGGGTFVGTAGADSNEDGRVSSADLIECAVVLSTP